MTGDLHSLSSIDLDAIVAALKTGRLRLPLSQTKLERLLGDRVATECLPHFQRFEQTGLSEDQLSVVLELIAADRRCHRSDPAVELVTTGPETPGIANRDTSVVVKELFSNAKESVLIAGFAVYQGQAVFQSLAERMTEVPSLKVRSVLDVSRPQGDSSRDQEIVRRFAERFRSRQWPLTAALPEVYFDPRALLQGADKRACMHAKCIVVDEQSVFISSANFTEAAHHRNIEAGLLVQDHRLARQLVGFFDTLLREGKLQAMQF